MIAQTTTNARSHSTRDEKRLLIATIAVSNLDAADLAPFLAVLMICKLEQLTDLELERSYAQAQIAARKEPDRFAKAAPTKESLIESIQTLIASK
jgi:hypothetical protein